jgi:hypothetical protein
MTTLNVPLNGTQRFLLANNIFRNQLAYNATYNNATRVEMNINPDTGKIGKK